uniref:Putative GIY-YIG homing endonuclease n=2 Tax=Ignatiaceae TaxID=2682551 RepID=A0A1W6EGV4_9CHLO|nr:putative GIY-YIG homing endonuclease [Pseudocharacium americanum]YP_009367742.1 putative GIY-YIG homing endonuclease [Ignatius tetrasporus]ARK14628.1 putative GIY-YIG homing endonuclease [Pseudocharacium americanum]ARK14717.1 putative GIY-YIG homing endonuclease [Ignatius tetrasporus]
MNPKIKINKNLVNIISTLLNGESLRKSLALRCFDNKKANLGLTNANSVFEQKCSIDSNILQKGLNSLDNPVLRGSFTLVLTEQELDFFDQIARQAFIEILNIKLSKITSESAYLNTIHLTTDPGQIQNKRPGVYVIKNIQNGLCVVGQTKDLKKRFYQYTSRGQSTDFEKNRINKNFYVDVQKILSQNLKYGHVFQRLVVYTWVNDKKEPLDIENSLNLKNQMSYLEHRLILSFFECGLCYNTNAAFPQLAETAKFSQILKNYQTIARSAIPQIDRSSIDSPEKTMQKKISKSKRGVGPCRSKPFKMGTFYFYSKPDYEAFRQSLKKEDRKKFKSVPHLRQILEANCALRNLPNAEISDAEIRYLTEEEIKKAEIQNLFIKVK